MNHLISSPMSPFAAGPLAAWCVRTVTYPLHEALRGRRTVAELRDLEQITRTTPEQLAEICDARLGALLRFVGQHNPHYSQIFRAAGIKLDSTDPAADLRRMPILEKAAVRAAGEKLVSRILPGGASPLSSGGTSGDTLHFIVDRIRQAQTLAARQFMQQRIGVRPGERRAYFWGSPIEQRGSSLRRWRDRLLNEVLLNAFDLSLPALDRHLDRLSAFRALLLYAYPSAAAALARRAARTGRHSAFASLRAVVLTGEEVREEDRAAIHQVCGCPVVQEYGSREIGLIAHECLHGGLHVLSPHVLVETVQSAESSQRGGELLLTTLNTRAQPFIRYRVGDAGTTLSDACSCGLPLPLMRLDGGKVTGFITLAGGRRCHGAIVSHIVRDQPGIVQFKTIQRSVDRFDLLLVTDDEFPAGARAIIERRYRDLFGGGVKLNCEFVDQIPPDPSGKRRYFVSEVADSTDDA